MCRPDDFPPYETACRSCDMPSRLCICEMPAPGYDARTRPIPPLYDGPRCESCGGDHHPGREPITEEDPPMTEQHIERIAIVFVLMLIAGAMLLVAGLAPALQDVLSAIGV